MAFKKSHITFGVVELLCSPLYVVSQERFLVFYVVYLKTEGSGVLRFIPQTCINMSTPCNLVYIEPGVHILSDVL